MGFLLSVLAYFMLLILTPIGIVLSLLKRPKDYFWRIAISLDQLGNVICAEPMNSLFLKDWTESKFGSPDETISSVLGKNQVNETLSNKGKILVHLLSILDNNKRISIYECECLREGFSSRFYPVSSIFTSITIC